MAYKFKVGDRVVVVKSKDETAEGFVGMHGTVTHRGDDLEFNYSVLLDGHSDDFEGSMFFYTQELEAE